MTENQIPKPGEPVQLANGSTALISSKLGAGDAAGEWRVIVKDPTRGNRRMVIAARAGDFMWSERA